MSVWTRKSRENDWHIALLETHLWARITLSLCMSVCLWVLQDLQHDRDAEGIHHCYKESTCFFSLQGVQNNRGDTGEGGLVRTLMCKEIRWSWKNEKIKWSHHEQTGLRKQQSHYEQQKREYIQINMVLWLKVRTLIRCSWWCLSAKQLFNQLSVWFCRNNSHAVLLLWTQMQMLKQQTPEII